jgi:alanyl-tRNA synthetase
MRTTDEIRQTYLDFFAERGHKIVPSAPLIPRDDPSLLFTSAGMVPFKNYYSGAVDPLPFTRAASCQKCFRAGGKASDLENVGKTLRHHTFFEMLGNFSFGDYFKREACAWALEFSRDVAKLDMSRVWVTYHQDDDETREIWVKELGYPADRVIPLGDKDNWWGPAGDSGACGPCSEMHYDRGPEFGTGPEDKIGGSTDRFLEYWNMVFPQYDHQIDGSRPILKNRGIDTGLGLARLAALLQGAKSAYTIDAMWPITKAVAEAAGVDYEKATNKQQLAVNAIADHIRALTFLISEGQVIGNTERGYVLKRVLRRGARFGRFLGKHEPFIHKLVPVVIDTMGHVYPELKEKPKFVARVIEADEEQFHRTMDKGMKMIEEELDRLRKSGDKVFPGELAFHLWQQEGIPREDTQEIASDNGFGVDEAGYKEAEKRHVSASKAASTFGGGAGEEAYKNLAAEVGATKFLGYDQLIAGATVLAVFRDGERVERLDSGQTGEVVLDESPFYAESGGQVGDRGALIAPNGRFTVRDTQKTPGGVYRHIGKVLEGSISVGQSCKATVDEPLRRDTARNHSATHLMQGALKRVLGSHVTQRGSLVNEKGLRFDFTHLEPMTREQIRQVEELVNQQARSNFVVKTDVLPADKASQVPGVIAPFDERYSSDKIRVVMMGTPISGDAPNLKYWDAEYCGGTHVERTGEIGVFVIKAESSIAQGIRRVEALTGGVAEDYLCMARDAYRDLSAMLSVDGTQVVNAVRKLADQKRELEGEVAGLKKKLASGAMDDILSDRVEVKGAMLYRHRFQNASPEEMRHVSVELAKKAGENAVIVFASETDGKASILVSVGEGLRNSLHAGRMIKELAAVVGGGGGGRPDFAQAGGKSPERIPEALALAERLLDKVEV